MYVREDHIAGVHGLGCQLVCYLEQMCMDLTITMMPCPWVNDNHNFNVHTYVVAALFFLMRRATLFDGQK